MKQRFFNMGNKLSTAHKTRNVKKDGQGLAIREAKNVPHSSGTHSEKDQGEGKSTPNEGTFSQRWRKGDLSGISWKS